MLLVVHAFDSDLIINTQELAAIQKTDRGEDAYRLKFYMKNGTTIDVIVAGEEAAEKIMSKAFFYMKGDRDGHYN
jgi:hypothetical protein